MPFLLSVILPAFNEEQNILHCLREIQNAMRGRPVEILVVDDGSTDRTVEAALGGGEAVTVLRLSRNFGKEGAIFAGLEQAKGDYIAVMDCDMQHPPALLPRMLKMMKTADIVHAVKKYPKSKGRHCANLFYRIFYRLSGMELQNRSDYIMMSRKTADSILRLPERQTFFRAMSSWVGFAQKSIFFTPPPRRNGTGKWTKGKLCKYAVSGIAAFSSLPLYLVVLFGIIFFLFALAVGLHTLIMKLTGNTVPGLTTVILLILISAGTILLGMGIIGIYLAKIYEELKGRPRYIISEKLRKTPDRRGEDE